MPIDTAMQDVLLFGADRTGKKDSSGALQKAVDALAALGGGVIRLPAGRYLLENPVDLTGRWGIQFGGASGGAGSQQNSDLIRGTEIFVQTPGVNAFELGLSKGIVFRDMQFRRPALLETDPGDAIHAVENTSDCRIIDCYFGRWFRGAYLENSWQTYLRGCAFLNCHIGAAVNINNSGPGLPVSNDVKFQQCIFGQCSKYELFVNANTVYVVGCDFESIVSELGIYGKFGNHCVIANNSYVHGMRFENMKWVRVLGNQVSTSPAQGIFLFQSDHAVVSNNVVTNSVSNGIQLATNSDSLVTDNQILDSGNSAFSRGVLIRDGSNRNTVRGNLVRSATAGNYAIEVLDAASAENVIDANDLQRR